MKGARRKTLHMFLFQIRISIDVSAFQVFLNVEVHKTSGLMNFFGYFEPPLY